MTCIVENGYLSKDDAALLSSYVDAGANDDSLVFLMSEDYDAIVARVKSCQKRLERMQEHLDTIKCFADSVVIKTIEQSIERLTEGVLDNYWMDQQRYEHAADYALEYPPVEILQAELDAMTEEEREAEEEQFDDWNLTGSAADYRYEKVFMPSALKNYVGH